MLAVVAFTAGTLVSLATSWLLVSRLERIGERLGLSEALLGIVAALAADAPEISAAVSALTSRQQSVGAGVVLGSNVFNLAALLGLGAVVAGWIGLHRKVVLLGGAIAMCVAVLCLAVVSGLLPVTAGLALATAVLALYMVVLGTEGQGIDRLRLPQRWCTWLRSAVTEEEIELADAIRPSRGRCPDVVASSVALAVVIAASVVMERSASALGQRYGIPQIVVGGLILAAVTSLPNAVAAVYLARRGRGAAALSTALNSNTINVVVGLLLPAALLGLGQPSGQALLVTGWYAGLGLAVLTLAWRHRGLGRGTGILIIAAYAAFTATVMITGYEINRGPAVIAGLGVLAALLLTTGLAPFGRSGRARFRNPTSVTSEQPDAPQRAGTATASEDGHQPPGCSVMPVSRRPSAAIGRESLLPGWSIGRVWALSLLLPVLAAAIDAAAGHRIVLIGLLILGPCCALLTGRWVPTALTGVWVTGFAIALGIPDGIWASSTHVAFITAVTVVGLACTGAAALIGKARE